jgi:hypothetical protein
MRRWCCVQQPVAKRNSQQGKAKPNKVIHMSLSLKEDVKLRETENAWKPTRVKGTGNNEEEVKTEVCIWNCCIVFQLHGRRVCEKCVDTSSVRHLVQGATEKF